MKKSAISWIFFWVFLSSEMLLLGLTYRICSIYNRKLMNLKTTVGHKHEFFIRLIQLIDAHYTEERGVEFYAEAAFVRCR